ncbi:hypothetical protein [Andreprevotia chitinilytica]|uniref:hypothetical protein n=1 Tax=Andreprevotia chitinilytica TaxID=396808 RepID=UPI0012EB0B9C|nr:hypothetical protein [Andreprevotia chitinilytica]
MRWVRLLRLVGALILLGAFNLANSAPAASSPATGGEPKVAAEKPGKYMDVYSLRCGSGYCDTRTSYCETIKTDVPELPSDYACKPLPKSCLSQSASGVKDCGCFPAKTRCDFCGSAKTGDIAGFYRTCIGGH